jgi:hypothetical protein
MNIETKIDHIAKIRIHTVSGDFDFDEIYHVVEEIYEDPDFDPELNSVWDLTNVFGLQLLEPDQLKKLVAFVAKERSLHGAIKTALVVAKKIDFGIAHVYELSLKSDSDNEVMVFKDLDKAIDWMKESYGEDCGALDV